MPEKIDSRDALRGWLEDKPREWAQVLALRSALRVLPLIGTDAGNARLHLSVFRAMAISWAARKWPAHDIGLAADAAADAANAAAYAANAAAYAADAAAYAADAAANAAYAAADAANAAAYAAADAAANAAALWEEIDREAQYLSGGGTPDQLIRHSLWGGPVPNALEGAWRDLARTMVARDPASAHWVHWYDRRRDGSDHGFLINDADDEALTMRVVQQDNAFWNRPPEEVNAEIARWIAEAQASAEPVVAELEEPLPHAIGLRFDDSNRLRYDPTANAEALDRDQDAIDRHSECLRLARKWRDRCHTEIGGNSAAELIEDCDLFVDALGESINAMRPMLVVMRFVTLEELLKSQASRDPASDIVALPDRPLKDLRTLVKNAGIFIALDGELAATYRAEPGNVTVAPVKPSTAITLVGAANRAGLTDNEVRVIIEVEVKQARDPNADPAAAERLSRDTNHVVRRLLGRIMAASKEVLKNAKNIETVSGWLKEGWHWVAQHQQSIIAFFPGRAEIAGWIEALLRAMGRGG